MRCSTTCCDLLPGCRPTCRRAPLVTWRCLRCAACGSRLVGLADVGVAGIAAHPHISLDELSCHVAHDLP